ncbi:MAG TPA: penicillin acylase family protein [Bryobacteraceae bacterium]|nr:penicillin acylase family protein [Bryobacteraceae bacterium]
MALKRVLQYFNIAVLAALILAAVAVYWYAWRPLPETSGTLEAPVDGRVSIARDSLGVPHISAVSVEDALFAQGFATAQDRLWQMDGLRRLAAGRLAEVLGQQFVEADREARRFRIDRIAAAEVRAMQPADRALLAAYARGVNYFIETHRNRLPLEFNLLRYDPRPWRVEDSIAVWLHLYRELTSTLPDKLAKAAMLSGGDPAKVAVLFPSLAGGETQPGSNAWVISGAHTANGKPLLSNDPHLEYSNPGIWHMAHLRAPGLDVTGVALPGVPCIIIGHNQRIAWGVTNLGFDVQDLYLEQIDLRTGRYVFRGQTEQAQLEREAIPVKDSRPVEFAQWVTRHGPVFVEQGRALAMRWAAADVEGFKFPLLDLDRARNWQEFTAALAGYPGPGQNFVYADVDGNIGYQATGRLPVRKYEADVPVDGSSGAAEWEGYIPFEQLPRTYNPASGMIASANQNPFPANYPYRVRGSFAAPYRVNRIVQLLRARGKWRAGEMLSIQTDVYSEFGRYLSRELVAAYKRRGVRGPEVDQAVEALRTWDGRMEQGRAAPLIFTLAYQHLRAAVADRASPGHGLLYQDSSVFNAAYQLAPAALEDLLRRRAPGWFPDWDQALLRALVDGVDEGRRMQGRNISKWDYGRYIELSLPHPVVGRVPLLGRYFNIGPVAQSGSPLTVKQTTRRLGPSMRTTVDLGDLERSSMNLLIGESGQALSSHYKDQWKAYASGQSFPMQFQHVEAKGTLTLEPLRQ